MYVLQDCFIAFFGFTYKYTKRIPITVRNLIAFLCVVLLTSEFYILNVLNPIGITDFSLREMTFAGAILLAALAVMSVKGKLNRVEWNKWIVWPYLLGALYMLFTGFHHYPGANFDTFPILLIFFFPAICFVWDNRKQYDMYYNWLAKAAFVIGVVLVLATVVFAPAGENTLVSNRYCGLTTNSNTLSMLFMVPMAGTLFLIRKKNKFFFLNAMIVGTSLGIIFLSGSRGGIAVGILQVAAWAVLTVRKEYREYGLKCIALVLVVLIIIGICIPITKALIYRSDYVERQSSEQIDMEDNQTSVGKRFKTEGMNLNAFSSGRVDIWKWYVKQFNVLGNDCTEHTVPIGDEGRTTSYAHNTYIEISYRYGVPAGLCHLLFMVALIVYLVRAALIRGKSNYVIIAVFFSIAYFVESMLEIMILPFDRGPVTMFYLSLVGVFDNDIMCNGQSDRKGKH